MLPYSLRGIFTRNRLLSQLLDRLHLQPFSVRFCQGLRQRYRSDSLYINMLGRRTLLLLDVDAVRRVLEQSPRIYAEARLKRQGVSHFQPGAVTISRGEFWRDRRRFNEYVLASDQALHPDSAAFLDQVRDEVSMTPVATWDDCAALFEGITLRVIFGDPRKTSLTRDLSALMKQSNRIFFLKNSRLYASLNRAIREQMNKPLPSTLASRCTHAPITPLTRPDSQGPHWIFAMNETLAANTFRTLALIVAHPAVEAKVREEIRRVDPDSPAGDREPALLGRLCPGSHAVMAFGSTAGARKRPPNSRSVFPEGGGSSISPGRIAPYAILASCIVRPMPSRWDLLSPAGARPRAFCRDNDLYDPVEVGFVSDQAAARRERSFLFDTRLRGNENRGDSGAAYGTERPDPGKWALIEYVKTRGVDPR